jgi:transposase-like protein
MQIMLSIKEVNFYSDLIHKGLASPFECPFDISTKGHLVISAFNNRDEVYFRCIDCNSSFKLGLNSELKIKSIIDKHVSKMIYDWAKPHLTQNDI